MNDVIPPPPPASRNNDGCWKWGAISCLGIGCLGALAFIAMIVVVMNNPEVKRIVGKAIETGEKAQVVQRDFGEILSGIRRYSVDNRKYPAKLKDLVPKYIPAERLAPAFDPKGQPYTYVVPPKDAPESFVVLKYELPPPVPGPGMPAWQISMRLDGKVEGMDYNVQYRNGRVRAQSGAASQDE